MNRPMIGACNAAAIMYAALTEPAAANEFVCDCTSIVNANAFMPAGKRGMIDDNTMRRSSRSAKKVL